MMLRRYLTLLFVALAFSTTALADTYRMYVGDMMTLTVGKVNRVAVGNGKVMSTSILENGDLLILAETEGDTELKIWGLGNEEITHRFYVTKTNADRSAHEAVAVMKNIPGISTRQVGQNLVIEGFTNKTTKTMIDNVAKIYKEIINLTVEFSLAEISELLTQIPGIEVKKVGKYAVVTGAIDAKGKAALEAIKASFPEILDLTNEGKIATEPMVYLNVQITEFNTNALEKLGIDWKTSIAGPSAGIVKTFSHNGSATELTAFNNQTGDPLLSAGEGAVLGRASFGYFGIATLITSAINLAVSTGDAMILASPTLSAKSGGKANFLSGGEIPIPVPGDNGQTNIEYKEYGIKLDIEPTAGLGGHISAKIMTEVSSVDNSVAVNGVPGFRTRNAETEVNLQNGQTLVISGLVNRELGHDVSKIKWLGDIPILGELFKSTNFRNNRSDLVIFITPTIFDPESEINKAQIQKASDLRDRFIKAIDEDAEILD
jgi:pilus assembly protein CpaC